MAKKVLVVEDDINIAEEKGQTVIEADRSLPVSQQFLALAKTLLETKAASNEK